MTSAGMLFCLRLVLSVFLERDYVNLISFIISHSEMFSWQIKTASHFCEEVILSLSLSTIDWAYQHLTSEIVMTASINTKYLI